MKVALSTPGRFHTFDLARELYRRGVLAGIFTGYPRFKLRHEGLPPHLVHTYPWFMTPYMAWPWGRWLSRELMQQWEYLISMTFSRWLARRVPACDVYVGLSGTSLTAGRLVQGRGGRYVCDRGSAHIREQDALLREEHERWEQPFNGIDPRAIEREEAEYAAADVITVPSDFALESFARRGVPREKLRLLPYGVNLQRFSKVGSPAKDSFDVVFVGGMTLQKGVPYLLQAFDRLRTPAKRLHLVGTASPALIHAMRGRGLWRGDIVVHGHVPQMQLRALISRCHVMVLPSVQEGFGMVMAQALACGCPVIASQNTGASNLFSDGVEGFIVPIRDSQAIAERLQLLADDRQRRDAMSENALARVQALGGWALYGDCALQIYTELAAA